MTNITPVSPEVTTSPVYRIEGQRDRWIYPNERLTPSNTEILRDINLSEQGIATVRSGYVDYNATSLAENILGMVQQEYTTGTFELVVTPTKVYIDNGTTQTDITGTLTLSAGANDYYRFAFIKDQIVATNGSDEVWVKDNDFSAPTNATALTGMPFTKCDDLIEHKGILLAFGPTESAVDYPTRVRWCDIDTRTNTVDITDWPATFYTEVYEGGTPILGAVDNFGRVLVFKSDGLYPGQLDVQDGFIQFTTSEQEVKRGFHPIAKNSLIARPEFVFGVAREGAFVITPDLQYRLITFDNQPGWKALNQTRLANAVSYIREDDHQIRTLLNSASSSTGHDVEMVWDWETDDLWFDRPTDSINYASRVVLLSVEYGWWGEVSGKTFKADTGKTDDGLSFGWQIKMAPNDLGYPGKQKTIVDFITIYDYADGQTSAALTLYRDRGRKSSFTSTVELSTPGLVWNDGTTSWNDGTLWGGGSVNAQDTPFVNLQAETITPEWTGNSPAKIVGYQARFIVLE